MRGLLVVLLLGAVMALPRRAPAGDDLKEELTQEQIDALHDLENAETDEEAEAAKERFNDASARQLELRKSKINDVIERGQKPLPSEPQPGPPR
jgi:hypothetical protein